MANSKISGDHVYWRVLGTDMRKLCLMAVVLIALSLSACIGRQPPQQGTWSAENGFKTKLSDQAPYSPQNPE
jgi:hypothetical protein